MKKTFPVIVLLIVTALALAILSSRSPADAYGPQAAGQLTLASQEWQEGQYLASAGHYLSGLALSAADTLRRSGTALLLIQSQDLFRRGQVRAAFDLCKRASALSIEELPSERLCRNIQDQMKGVPTSDPAG